MALNQALLEEPKKPLAPARGLLAGLTVAFMLGIICLAWQPTSIKQKPQTRGGTKLEVSAFNALPEGVAAPPPPFFNIHAHSLYEAGLEHGRLARSRIQGWFATPEMQNMFRFIASGAGAKAFAQLKKDNEAEFPEYVEELKGVADGSGFPLDQIWCANMLNELENLMIMYKQSKEKIDHCSDIYAISPKGSAHGFAHGHNDDWNAAVKPFWYFMSYSYNGSGVGSDRGPGFASCAGMVYPGAVIGWAPTWNKHGIFATQNSLHPRKSRARGLACAFVQRRATCNSRTLDEAISVLRQGGWSEGASLNIVDLHGKRMANVEVWEDISSSVEITEKMGNYSHFNEYKHLQFSGDSIDDQSHHERQRRVDALPAPQTDLDIMNLLSGVKLYGWHSTISTFVLNGTTGKFTVWYGRPAMHNPPAYNWNLSTFFEFL